MVDQWVKDITMSCLPKEDIIDNETYEIIREPKTGDIVYFRAFHNSEKCGYKINDFYKVEIIEGQYWGTHGLSNFWYWYKLDDKNNRIKKEHGYGNFMIKIKQ